MLYAFTLTIQIQVSRNKAKQNLSFLGSWPCHWPSRTMLVMKEKDTVDRTLKVCVKGGTEERD